MTIPMQAAPRDAQKARAVNELVTAEFRGACKALKIDDAATMQLFKVALTTFPLTLDNALLLKGGRDVLAAEYESALRANPAGEVAYTPGQNKDVDDAIAIAVEAEFPRPTKVVSNEVTANGCTVWFSVDDNSYFVESIESGARAVGSAAAACAACDSGAAADGLYPAVLALRDDPTLVVPADDRREGIQRGSEADSRN